MKLKLIILLSVLYITSFSQWLDIAHDQIFYTWDNAVVSEKIGRVNCNMNWDTITSISYAIVLDTSGLFAINSDSIYFSSVTGLQTSVTYWITFSVSDGSIKDTANGYIYIYNDANMTEWKDNYSSLIGGHIYYFQRGHTYGLDQTIVIDDDNITFMAVGNGAYPILNCNFTSASYEYMFKPWADYITITGLEMHRNSNAYGNKGSLAMDYSDHLTYDNNRWIGTQDYAWYNVFRYDRDYVAYDHKILNEYTEYSYDDVGWYQNISGQEITGCLYRKLGVDGEGSNGSDGFQWGWDVGNTIINEFRDIRYNCIDHSDNMYKHGFVLGNAQYHKGYDTIMYNRIIGYAPGSTLNGWSFNGISMDGSSYVHVEGNVIENCDRGFVVDEKDCKHITWVNNVLKNIIYQAFWVSHNLDSSLIAHNTFYNINTSDGTDRIFVGEIHATDTFENNIVHLAHGATMWEMELCVRDKNIYNDTTGTGYTIVNDETVDDAEFTDVGTGDFTLLEISPAINVGNDLGIVLDYKQSLRDATPDIGAFEYLSDDNIYYPLCSIYEYYNATDNLSDDIKLDQHEGQTFTVGSVGLNSNFTIDSFRVKLWRLGLPDICTISIFRTDISGFPVGDTLSKGTFNANTLTESSVGEWLSVSMSTYDFKHDTTYIFVLSCDGESGVNELNWVGDDPGTYSGGTNVYYKNGSWLTSSIDFNFEICGHEMDICYTPYNLSGNSLYYDLNNYSLLLSWYAGSGNGIKSQYRWKKSTSSIWNYYVTGDYTEINESVGFLVPKGFIYNWQVRDICESDTSNWAIGNNISTETKYKKLDAASGYYHFGTKGLSLIDKEIQDINSTSIVYSDGYLYVGGYDEILSYSVSDGELTYVDSYSLYGCSYVEAIDIANNYIYIGTRDSGLMSFSVSSGNFTFIDREKWIESNSYVTDVKIDGDTLWVTSNSYRGLTSYNISNGIFGSIIKTEATATYYDDLFIVGKYLFTANQVNGIRSYLKNNGNFQHIESNSNGAYSYAITGNENHIFALNNNTGGVDVYENNNGDLTYLSNTTLSSNSLAGFYLNNKLYVCTLTMGLIIYELVENNLILRNQIDNGDYYYDITNSGEYIFIPSFGTGVLSYKYSDNHKVKMIVF